MIGGKPIEDVQVGDLVRVRRGAAVFTAVVAAVTEDEIGVEIQWDDGAEEDPDRIPPVYYYRRDKVRPWYPDAPSAGTQIAQGYLQKGWGEKAWGGPAAS